MKHHANRGREWQAIVEDQHACYAREGRCGWVRNEPTRMSRFADHDSDDAVVRGRGQPDYVVYGHEDGRPWMFGLEAKDHGGGHFPLSGVSRWQAQRLDSFVQQRHGALLIIRLGDRVFLVVWESVVSDWYINRGRGVDLTPNDPRMIETFGVDYLGAALGLLPTFQHRPFHQD